MDLETSFDIDWNKIIIDKDLNSLFLAGTLPRKQILRQQMRLEDQVVAVCALKNIERNNYLWVKIFDDENSNVSMITDMTLNKHENILAVVGSSNSLNSQFIFFLDSLSGEPLKKGFKLPYQIINSKTLEMLKVYSLTFTAYNLCLIGENENENQKLALINLKTGQVLLNHDLGQLYCTEASTCLISVNSVSQHQETIIVGGGKKNVSSTAIILTLNQDMNNLTPNENSIDLKHQSYLDQMSHYSQAGAWLIFATVVKSDRKSQGIYKISYTGPYFQHFGETQIFLESEKFQQIVQIYFDGNNLHGISIDQSQLYYWQVRSEFDQMKVVKKFDSNVIKIFQQIGTFSDTIEEIFLKKSQLIVEESINFTRGKISEIKSFSEFSNHQLEKNTNIQFNHTEINFKEEFFSNQIQMEQPRNLVAGYCGTPMTVTVPNQIWDLSQNNGFFSTGKVAFGLPAAGFYNRVQWDCNSNLTLTHSVSPTPANTFSKQYGGFWNNDTGVFEAEIAFFSNSNQLTPAVYVVTWAFTNNIDSSFVQTISFNVTVVNNCQSTTSLGMTIGATNILPAQSYVVSQNQFIGAWGEPLCYTVPTFTVSGESLCTIGHMFLEHTVTCSGCSGNFINIFSYSYFYSNPGTICWLSYNNGDIGEYNVTVSANILRNGMPTTINYQSYILTITATDCYNSQDIYVKSYYKANSVNPTPAYQTLEQGLTIINYVAPGPIQTGILNPCAEYSVFCNVSDIQYGVLTANLSQPGVFTINNNSINSIISVQKFTQVVPECTDFIVICNLTRAFPIESSSRSYLQICISNQFCNVSTNAFTLQSLNTTSLNSFYNITWETGSVNASHTINPLDDWCKDTDINYVLSISPNRTFITINSTTGIVSWQTDNKSEISNILFPEVINIQVIASVFRLNSLTVAKTIDFTLTLFPKSCLSSKDIITIATLTVPDQAYTISYPQGFVNQTVMTVTSTYCTESDITYLMQVSPSNTFINVNNTDDVNFNTNWHTFDNTLAGTYTITRDGTISRTYMLPVVCTGQFLLTVTAVTCYNSLDENLTITPIPLATQIYSLTNPATLYQIQPDFTVNDTNGYCTNTDIVYSFTWTLITGTGLNNLSLIQNPNQNNVTCQSSLYTDIGIYNIQMIANINNLNTTLNRQSVSSFNLKIITSCMNTTPKILSNKLAKQFYTVANNQTFFNYTGAFDVTNSLSCSISDLFYTLSVTSPNISVTPPNQTFSFNNVTTQISIFSINNSDTGSYQVTVTAWIWSFNDVTGLVKSYLNTSVIDYEILFRYCNQSFDIFSPNVISVAPNFTYQILKIPSDAQNFTFSEFGVGTSLYCNSTQIKYIVSVPTTNNFIFSDNMTVIWPTIVNTHEGTYTFNLTGIINRNLTPDGFIGSNFSPNLTQTVTLVILASNCYNSTNNVLLLNKDYYPSYIQYIIGSPQNEFTFRTGYINSPIGGCTMDDSYYQIYVTDNPQFTFVNLTQKKVIWYTTNSTDQGEYEIVFEQIVQRRNSNIISTINVWLNVSTNHEPVLNGMFESNYKVDQLSKGIQQIELLPYDQDGNLDKVFILQDPNQIFSVSNNTLMFDTIKLLKQAKPYDDFEYEIRIQVVDDLGLYNIYPIIFTIPKDSSLVPKIESTRYGGKETQENFVQITEKTETQTSQNLDFWPPGWNKLEVSNQGELTIRFNKSMIIPSNYTNMDFKQLKIDILPGTTIDMKYLNFTWNVTEFKQTYFVIQMKFKYPLYISQNQRGFKEQVVVTCMDTSFFMSKNFIKLPINTHIQKIIPSQLSNSLQAAKILNTITDVTDGGGKAFVLATFFVNILCSASLSLLWGMVNCLQIIGNLPGFNILTPANAEIFYSSILNLAQFNFFPTKEIITKLLGDEGTELFIKMGSMFLFSLILILGLIVLSLVYRWRRANKFTKFFYKELRDQLFWNSTLRYIIESYMNLSLVALTKIKNDPSWGNTKDGFATMFAILTITVCGIVPISVTLYFQKNIQNFQDHSFNRQFKEFANSLDQNSRFCGLYVSIFCYRRLVQCLMILYLDNYPSLQLILQTYLSITCVILFAKVKTIKNEIDRQIEYFNEFSVLLCIYHCYAFSSYVPDPITRYYVGYSLIGFTLFNIMVNSIRMIIQTLKNIKAKWRIFKIKQARNKKIKQRQQAMLDRQKQKVYDCERDGYRKLIEEFNREFPECAIELAQLKTSNKRRLNKGELNPLEKIQELPSEENQSSHVVSQRKHSGQDLELGNKIQRNQNSNQKVRSPKNILNAKNLASLPVQKPEIFFKSRSPKNKLSQENLALLPVQKPISEFFRPKVQEKKSTIAPLTAENLKKLPTTLPTIQQNQQQLVGQNCEKDVQIAPKLVQAKLSKVPMNAQLLPVEIKSPITLTAKNLQKLPVQNPLFGLRFQMSGRQKVQSKR